MCVEGELWVEMGRLRSEGKDGRWMGIGER